MKTVKLSALIALLLACAGSAQALSFDFGDTSAYGSDLTAALAKAANNWSSRITDNVTVKIDFSFANLGQNVIGGTLPTFASASFSTYRTALAGDATSSLDTSAVASLGTGSSYSTLVNGYNYGTTFGTYYTANLNQVRLTTANAHAVGLLAGYTGADAEMEFNNQFAYDFDPSDGVTSGAIDFVGVVTHEIGHALGFDSGVDDLETILLNRYISTGQGLFLNDYNTATTSLDLFRYSEFVDGNGDPLALRNIGVFDDAKFFSADGGTTLGAEFATGADLGDGGQASHWKDGGNFGVMDPTVNADGTVDGISQYDLNAFDAIGYDIKPVPEPATLAALGGALVVFARRRRR